MLKPKSPKHPAKAKRSPQWRATRSRFLAKNYQCAACGGRTKLEVHHIVPFHTAPQLELDHDNLIVLCESRRSVNCHLLFGHLGDYRAANASVRADAAYWRARLRDRKRV